MNGVKGLVMQAAKVTQQAKFFTWNRDALCS